ncbi:unnamed protein product [Closterium sp. NIES-53]
MKRVFLIALGRFEVRGYMYAQAAQDSEPCLYRPLPSNITIFALDFSGSGMSQGDYVTLGRFEVQRGTECVSNESQFVVLCCDGKPKGKAVIVLLLSNINVFALDFSGSGMSQGNYVTLGRFESWTIYEQKALCRFPPLIRDPALLLCFSSPHSLPSPPHPSTGGPLNSGGPSTYVGLCAALCLLLIPPSSALTALVASHLSPPPTSLSDGGSLNRGGPSTSRGLCVAPLTFLLLLCFSAAPLCFPPPPSPFQMEDLSTVVDHLRAEGSVSLIGLWGRSMGAVTS